MSFAEPTPLQRLLDRAEVQALLAELEAMMRGAQLALFGRNGRLFAGSGDWPLDAVAQAMQDGTTRQIDDCVIYPLHVRSSIFGALAARGATSHEALRAIQRSLQMLLNQALERRDVARETLERYREINLLYRIGETLGACLNPEAIPGLQLTEAQGVIQSDVSAVLLPASDDAVQLAVRAHLGDARYLNDMLRVAQELIERVQRTGRPDILTAHDRIGTVLCAPLKAQERVLGVVVLGRLEGAPMFTASDEKLMLALAGQAGIGLERARLHQEEIARQRLEEELSIGRKIQLSLLPERLPSLRGWEFAVEYQAARQVGGDFYDFFEAPGETPRLGMVIADVTDKGVPAALMMAHSRAIIRAESMSGRNPAQVLERTNQLLVQENRSSLYLTAFYATLDIEQGELVYANGGHNPTFWLQAQSGECRELLSRSFLLGAFPGIRLEERRIEIARGDVLLFYTDGVTEAQNIDSKLFGEENLQAILQTHRHAGAAQIARAITDAVQSFRGPAQQSDDFTFFVIKRLHAQ
jgi:serine phosphatase RsbU (regulator of sigma subunit)